MLAHLVLVTRLTRTMEAVVDFEQLYGTQNETVVKELSIAGHNVLETFQFHSPFGMRPHGNSEKFKLGRWTYPLHSIGLCTERGCSRLCPSVCIWRFEMYIYLAITWPPSV